MRVFAAMLAVLGVLLPPLIKSAPLHAAEIVVLSGNGAKDALIEIIPLFERATGHAVNVTYAGGPAWMAKLRGGMAGDLLIVPDENSDPLLKEGRLVAGSRIAFAHSYMSAAVRAGAAKPRIDTPESFKQALLAARSVAYGAAASGDQLVKILEALGIANEIKAKHVAPTPGLVRVGDLVARGEAEIGIHQQSELLPIAGIDIIGPLPASLQKPIVFSAAVITASKQRETAGEFVGFLRSEAATPFITKHGMLRP